MPNYFHIPVLLAFTSLLNTSPAQSPPYILEIEALAQVPGLHSFSFAEWQGKWLFAGGRTNGLHGMSSNDNFPIEHANNYFVVIDTATWQSWYSPLNVLPLSIADPIRSTNMQYIGEKEYLYMMGGFGWDSTAMGYTTFNTLTAIRVDSMIHAVINGKPVAPHIRQVKDTLFAVCGGEAGKLGNSYYLIGGHYFSGRYSEDPSPIFFQAYTNSIVNFSLTDDGNNISVSNINRQKDTLRFHRRDLNAAPVIKPDGTEAIGIYGGVFRYDENIPWLEPILIESSSIKTDSSFQQKMNQYTTAVMPVSDSVSGNMYTTFFAGTSLYDYDPIKDSFIYDNKVPFVSDISTLACDKNGKYSELMMPLQMSGLLGTNAKFILNKKIPHYANGVIKLDRLVPGKRVFAGFIFGGIRATQPNQGSSTANDTVYRVYITPDQASYMKESSNNVAALSVFPNPAKNILQVQYKIKQSGFTEALLFDVSGRKISSLFNGRQSAGSHLLVFPVEINPGLYFLKVRTAAGERTEKVIIE